MLRLLSPPATKTEFTHKRERSFPPKLYRLSTRNVLPALALISIAFFTACIAWKDSHSARSGRTSADGLFDYGAVLEVFPEHSLPPHSVPSPNILPPQLDPLNHEHGPLRGPPTAHFRGEPAKRDRIPRC